MVVTSTASLFLGVELWQKNASFSHFHYFFTVEDGVSSDDILSKKDTRYRFYRTSNIVFNYIHPNRIIEPSFHNLNQKNEKDNNKLMIMFSCLSMSFTFFI